MGSAVLAVWPGLDRVTASLALPATSGVAGGCAGAEALLGQLAARLPQLAPAAATWLTALACDCPAWQLAGAGEGHVLLGTAADQQLKARLWVLAEQLRLDEPGCVRLALVPLGAVAWLTPHDAEAIVPLAEAGRVAVLGKLIEGWQGGTLSA